MKLTIKRVLFWYFAIIAPLAWAVEDNYTNRDYTAIPCGMFSHDVYQASDNFRNKIVLQDLLNFIENVTVTDNQKQRAFQAIQFVWKNQLDNPQLAYTLAMGLCMKPKTEMAPLSEPWTVSPRTSREYF